MEKMTLIFGRGTSRISKIILYITRSHYSHVGYIDPVTGLIIESIGGIGVRASTIEEFRKRYTEYHIATISVPSASIARQRMIEQLGKGYDDKAIWGILFRKDWHDADKWTCSELIAWASQLFRGDKLHRITQENLLVMSTPASFDFDSIPSGSVDDLFM